MMRKWSLVAVLAVGFTGCGSGSSGAPAEALTEYDFAADPALRLEPGQVGVTFLEPADGEGPGAIDTGTRGSDEFPIRVSTPTTITYALDAANRASTVAQAEMRSADGTVAFTLTPGSPTATVSLEPGDYGLVVTSGYTTAQQPDAGPRTIFLREGRAAGSAAATSAAAFERTVTLLTEIACAGTCKLAGVDLHGANLADARLSGADLSGANLKGANLTFASLDGANLAKADLSGANLFASNLRGSAQTGAILTGAVLGLATWIDGTVCTDGSVGACTPRTGLPAAQWTIFVYGHGDHSLTESLVVDISKMGSATLGADVNVLVVADYCAGNACADPTRDVLDPAGGKKVARGTQFLRIQGGDQKPVLVGTMPEENLDDPAVLQRWAGLAFKAYPARRQAVVLWDHGASWDGGFGGDRADGTVARPGAILAPELSTRLAAAMRDAGLPPDRKLEFVGFDTCLMAANEVIWDFRNVARVYIANAELDFGSGWAYGEILTWIARYPEASATEVGLKEVEYWDKLHLAKDADDRILRSHAAFDLSKVGRYQVDMKALADALVASEVIWGEAGRIRARTHPQYGALGASMESSYYDAGQFLTLLGQASSDASVAAAARKAAGSLADMTLAKVMGTARTSAGQSGMHLALNLKAQWSEENREGYARLPWDAEVRWSAVLDRLAKMDKGTAPEFDGSNGVAADGTAWLKVKATSPDAFEGRAFVAWIDERQHDFLSGVIWSGPLTTGTETTATWDGKLLVLTNGADWDYANVEPLVVTPQGPVLSRIPVRISAKDGSKAQDAYALVDSQSGLLVGLQIWEGSWSVKDLVYFRDWQLAPILASTSGESRLVGKKFTIPDASDVSVAGLKTVKRAPGKGTYKFGVNVRDVWGNESGKWAQNPLIVP